MKKITLLSAIALLLVGVTAAFAQEETQKETTSKSKNTAKYIPSIGVHGGALSYLGDIEGTDGATMFTYWKPAYGFYLEKKIGSIIGVSVNGMFGEVSKSQLDNDVFLNFETSITNFDLNILFDFDNGKIINEESLFSPYLSVGFGYLAFDPKGDLSTNGALYNHWSDGTLRDMAETTQGADSLSTVVSRDYDYETALKDSITDYSKTSYTIPIRFGLKFKLSRHIDARISAAYILSMTDYLDNVANGGNDNLFYTSFGLQYNFKARTKRDERFKDVDFSDIDKTDADGDGVFDDKDLCQGTPGGAKVDRKGCALDGDKDGVPDFYDKEPNTVAGAIVNKKGVAITEEMRAKEFLMKDSIETEYRVIKPNELSQEELAEIQKEYENANNAAIVGKSIIPEKFQELDSDKDNYISAKEVTNGIDGFFEGENNLSAKDLNTLIDFYFDQ